MKEKWSEKIASIAMEAMLYEVSATPKPGLVDRNNCGAHHDMDYFTFMSSVAALHHCFDEMVQIGNRHKKDSVKALLPELRKCGMEAEKQMFSFTGGINTHKGMIFTLGILCGCAGWQIGKDDFACQTLCALAAEMCEGICQKEYANLTEKKSLTKGERMYLEHGLSGVRGEVESGYQTVRKIAFPVYEKLRKEQVNINDALVQTLLYLIANTADTNIVSRHDMETAKYAKICAREIVEKGGILTEEGRARVLKMDEDFIQKYISPGGCADLLAVTHFLYTLQNYKFENKL